MLHVSPDFLVGGGIIVEPAFRKLYIMSTERKPFSELVNSETPVLVDFSAEWCGPCKMMPPVLQEVKRSLGDDVTILKIDVDRNPALARQFNVQSVPTLIVFQQGQVKWRQSGVVPANQLTPVLQSFMTQRKA
jgi:thioredoxin 1